MKKSQLNKIIKEEVSKVLNEDDDKYESLIYRIQSDILNSWVSTKVAQEDLETFLEMIYMDGDNDTMEDMRQMFGYLSSVANDYYKKMQQKL